MQPYETKDIFLDEVRKTYALFDREFDDVPEEKADVRIADVDKTPREMLAYQLGWLNLIISWEKDELSGKTVVTPAPEFKWNRLGPLYQQFYQKYQSDSLSQMRSLLRDAVREWCGWISRMSDTEFYEPGIRKWSVTNANWPLWKWLHINSVAPFKSFRAKIRKWKREQ